MDPKNCGSMSHCRFCKITTLAIATRLKAVRDSKFHEWWSVHLSEKFLNKMRNNIYNKPCNQLNKLIGLPLSEHQKPQQDSKYFVAACWEWILQSVDSVLLLFCYENGPQMWSCVVGLRSCTTSEWRTKPLNSLTWRACWLIRIFSSAASR